MIDGSIGDGAPRPPPGRDDRTTHTGTVWRSQAGSLLSRLAGRQRILGHPLSTVHRRVGNDSPCLRVVPDDGPQYAGRGVLP